MIRTLFTFMYLLLFIISIKIDSIDIHCDQLIQYEYIEYKKISLN